MEFDLVHAIHGMRCWITPPTPWNTLTSGPHRPVLILRRTSFAEGSAAAGPWAAVGDCFHISRCPRRGSRISNWAHARTPRHAQRRRGGSGKRCDPHQPTTTLNPQTTHKKPTQPTTQSSERRPEGRFCFPGPCASLNNTGMLSKRVKTRRNGQRSSQPPGFAFPCCCLFAMRVNICKLQLFDNVEKASGSAGVWSVRLFPSDVPAVPKGVGGSVNGAISYVVVYSVHSTSRGRLSGAIPRFDMVADFYIVGVDTYPNSAFSTRRAMMLNLGV